LRRLREKEYTRPGTIGFAYVVSYVMPYVLASALLLLACFLLYTAVRACRDPIGSRFETYAETGRGVLALWCLIAGMSLLARIPFLGALPAWWLLAVVLGVGFTFLYFVFPAPIRGSIEQFLGGSAADGDLLSNRYNQGLLAAAALVSLACLLK